MHGLGLRRVVFAVADPSSGAHALHITDANYRARARAVLVCQCAFEHIGENFHVPVRMSPEPSPRSNSIFIDHSKIAEAHVLRVVVVAERKRMTAVEPAGLRSTSFSCRPYSNHFHPPSISPLRNTLKQALMCK